MTGLGSFRGSAVFCKAATILKQGHISQEAFMQSCRVFHWRLIITGDTPLALITSGLIILWERNVAFGRLQMTLSSEAVSGFLQPLTAVIQNFWILNNCWDSSASQCFSDYHVNTSVAVSSVLHLIWAHAHQIKKKIMVLLLYSIQLCTRLLW